MVKHNKDKTGKFVKSDLNYNLTLAVRVDADLKEWVKQNGGSDFVRSLLIEEKARREAATVKGSDMGMG
ncbi:hypothetical protein [Nostoc sp.]